tara:strand:- start:2575 stop:3027 length:453 start_codon:yes stop_codon:yes gene_type:complete
MNRILILLLTLNLLLSCSYDPIFVNEKSDFKFTKIKSSGVTEVNEVVKDILTKKSYGDIEYNISFESEKNIEVVTSNQKGDPTVFEMLVIVDYIIFKNGKVVLTNQIKKRDVYNNIKDKFELLKYEENILTNISNNISNEILMSMRTLSK